MPRTGDEINEKYERLADFFESDDWPQGIERDGVPVRALR